MDSINREIIGILLEDGRATYHEIGTKIRRSAPAVKRRIDQMVARGEITGFTVRIGTAALGWTTEAYLELYYNGNVLRSELEKSLSKIPQVVGVWSVSGDADALIHVVADGMTDIENTIELIRANPKVDRTRSSIVLSKVFERPRN